MNHGSLNDGLLEKTRREAAARGQTLTSLIEQGLHLALAQSPSGTRRRTIVLPVSQKGGGVLPGVDVNNSTTLLELMEDDLPLEGKH